MNITNDEIKMKLQNCNVLFGLISKNVYPYISSILHNVEQYASYFQSYKTIIIDASTDNHTYNYIQSWTNKEPSYRQCYKQICLLSRPFALTEARNMYLSILEKDFIENTYLIVMDCDDVNENPIDEDGFLSNFRYTNWDGMFANQTLYYYDIYALRSSFCLNNYQHDPTIKLEQLHINKNNELIPVKSAFGGIAIYHTPKLIQCRYHMFEIFNDKNIETCEHVPFHYQLIDKGARLFINPRFINK